MTNFDPDRDLQIDRLIQARPETIWRCWAEPELFKAWFTPPGVDVIDCENVLEPGGRAYVVMRLPDGAEMPSEGAFLLVEPHKRLVYTDATGPGFRPKDSPFMTADTRLTPEAEGTLYSAHVMHADAEARKRHEEMGFHDGWGTTFGQLADLATSLEG